MTLSQSSDFHLRTFSRPSWKFHHPIPCSSPPIPEPNRMWNHRGSCCSQAAPHWAQGWGNCPLPFGLVDGHAIHQNRFPRGTPAWRYPPEWHELCWDNYQARGNAATAKKETAVKTCLLPVEWFRAETHQGFALFNLRNVNYTWCRAKIIICTVRKIHLNAL